MGYGRMGCGICGYGSMKVWDVSMGCGDWDNEYGRIGEYGM